jgi:glutamyl-tRNA synthetase/glutamyl-Q tRNA(Asp) synthetase
LHLGHIVNAIYVWGIARAYGGEVVLRVEDHDRSRCRPEFERALLEDLTWLGFHADVAPADSFATADREHAEAHAFRQSDNDARYLARLEALDALGVVYPCVCTRREIARLVPHAPGEEPRYPGTCRNRGCDPSATLARRLWMVEEDESFTDLRLGAIAQNPSLQCGDLLLRDRTGGWTYQFAVTVDDMVHAVDVIIRGEDLLSSTARQFALGRLLGRESPPMVLHHPLLVHTDGAKLSKAFGDTALRERRAAGASAETLIGEAAQLAGLTLSFRPIEAREVGALFA